MEDIDIDECQRMRVAVVGATSAGKSTFCNSLLGKAMLPMGVNATTTWPMYICPCECYPDGNLTIKKVPWPDDKSEVIVKFMTYHRECPGMPLISAAATNEEPCKSTGVVFMDLPGLNLHEDASYEQAFKDAIRTCQFAIFVHDISTPQESQGLIQMIDLLKNEFAKKLDVYTGPRLFVVCNKADRVSPSDLVTNMRHLANELATANGEIPLVINHIEAADDGFVPSYLSDPPNPTLPQNIFPMSASLACQARSILAGSINECDLDKFLMTQLGSHEARKVIREGTLRDKLERVTETMVKEGVMNSGLLHFESVFERLCLDYHQRRLDVLPQLRKLKEFLEICPLSESPCPVLYEKAAGRKTNAIKVAITMTALSLPIIVASGFMLSPLIAAEAAMLTAGIGITAAATVGAAAWGAAGLAFSHSKRLKHMSRKTISAQQVVESLKKLANHRPIDQLYHMQEDQTNDSDSLAPADDFYDYEMMDTAQGLVRYAGGFRDLGNGEYVYHGQGLVFHPHTQCTVISGHFQAGKMHGPAVIYDPGTGHAMIGAMFTEGHLDDFYPVVSGDLTDYDACIDNIQYNTAEDLLYENQRFRPWPWDGWGEPSHPNDPFGWCGHDGSLLHKNDVHLPGDHWVWEGDWEVVVDTDGTKYRTDKEGWRYALDFYANSSRWGELDGKLKFVRRRKWRRCRKLVEPL
eukprot:Ihof_evm4s175 gene=Ihof_evmTU4s175